MADIKGLEKVKAEAYITDAAALDRESKALATDLKAMDTRVVRYLISEVVHIEKHRNPTRLNQFFSTVTGAGYRVNAMHAFIQVFANVRLQKEKQEKEANGQKWTEFYTMRPVRKTWAYYDPAAKKAVKVAHFGELIDAAIAKPFTSFRPEPKVQDYSMPDAFTNFIKSAISKMDRQHDGDSIPLALLADLIDTARKHGVKIEAPTTLSLPEETQKAIHLVVDNDNTETNKEEAANPVRGRRHG